MVDFALVESTELISHEIWVIEKPWTFHTVYRKTLISRNFFDILQLMCLLLIWLFVWTRRPLMKRSVLKWRKLPMVPWKDFWIILRTKLFPLILLEMITALSLMPKLVSCSQAPLWNWCLGKFSLKYISEYVVEKPQRGNFMIFLSLRFYVKITWII